MIEVIEGNLTVPEHANAVVRLLSEYAGDPMGGGQELPAYTRDHLIAELRKRDGAHVILGFIEEEPAGLVICFEGFSTFACRPLLNIHDVVVSRKHRGKGLSKRMLQRAEAIALKLGCCKLTLEVLEGNHVAQAAYRASGFTGYELEPRMGKAMFWEKKLNPRNLLSKNTNKKPR
jgi:GNAT superfamily N-acetyltransferase